MKIAEYKPVFYTPDPYGEGQLGNDYTIINYGKALDTTVACVSVTANSNNGFDYVFKPIISTAIASLSLRRVGYIDSTSGFVLGSAPKFTLTVKQGLRAERVRENYIVSGSIGPYAISTSASSIDNDLVSISLSYSSSIIEVMISTEDLRLHADDTWSAAQLEQELAKLQYYIGLHTVITY